MLNQELRINRRLSERFSTRLHSVAFFNEKICTGIVENFSKDGIAMSADTHQAASMKDCIGRKIMVNVTNPANGCTMNLTCEIMWGPEAISDYRSYIGIKVIEPPISYIELLKNHIKL